MSTALPVLRTVAGGPWPGTADGITTPVVDPSTGQAYAHAPLSSAQDIEAAVTAGRATAVTAGHSTVTAGRAAAVTGGGRIGDRGFFLEPTVVTGPRHRDEMIQDEIFGPVVAVQGSVDEQQVVRWADDVVRCTAARSTPGSSTS